MLLCKKQEGAMKFCSWVGWCDCTSMHRILVKVGDWGKSNIERMRVLYRYHAVRNSIQRFLCRSLSFEQFLKVRELFAGWVATLYDAHTLYCWVVGAPTKKGGHLFILRLIPSAAIQFIPPLRLHFGDMKWKTNPFVASVREHRIACTIFNLYDSSSRNDRRSKT